MSKMSAEYHRQYYHNKVDKARKLRNQELRKVKLKQYVWDFLLGHPCVDCGEADPVVLEFDHVIGDKVKSICDTVRHGWSLTRLQSEIDKCEVRCANCHRRVTANRGGWFIG